MPSTHLSQLAMLRAAALIALLSGAAGSTGFMFYVGHRNPSSILLVLFAGWVLSSFVVLVFASDVSNRWPVPVRSALYMTRRGDGASRGVAHVSKLPFAQKWQLPTSL